MSLITRVLLGCDGSGVPRQGGVAGTGSYLSVGEGSGPEEMIGNVA